MRLAARLAAHLGIAITDCGDSLQDLLEDERNLRRMGPSVAQQIAEALLAGAREGDRGCITECVLARTLVTEPDLEEIESTIAFYGRCIDLADAPIWIRALMEQGAYELLAQLAALHGDWTDDAERSLCIAVLPLGVALDGDDAVGAANALEAIARRHREVAADLEVVVPRLCELVLDPPTHGAAASALAAIGDRRAAAALIESLALEDPTGAVYALRELNAAEAVPALADLCLRTTDAHLRSAIYYAVAQLGPADAASAVAACANPEELDMHVIQICQAGAERGDTASIRFLERARRSGNATMRAGAVRAISRVRGPNMVEELCRLAADDPDPDVRATAVQRLHELRDPRAFEALTIALRRGSRVAATALAALANPRALPHLVEALGRTDPTYYLDVMMKSAVLQAIGDLGLDEHDAWDAIAELLEYRNETVQGDAALALQQLRPACTTGSAALARRIARAASDAADQMVLLPKLERIARRGLPIANLVAAKGIVAALVVLERRVPLPEVTSVLDAWRTWVGASAS